MVIYSQEPEWAREFRYIVVIGQNVVPIPFNKRRWSVYLIPPTNSAGKRMLQRLNSVSITG